MKKMRYIAMLTAIVLITSGCADDSNGVKSRSGGGPKTVDDVIASVKKELDME